jgi:4-diphosphocytidyl-2-C-methyl-D-erythritol kinase
LAAFAQLADTLALDLSRPLGLDVDGPGADACGSVADNLVLKAAAALAARMDGLQSGHFTLEKRIPVAAGLGGGSADAAAALRLLARANGLALDDPRLLDAARASGADVLVCLDPRARVMRGIGEVLSEPVALPPLAAVLVNPGVALPTKEVFAAFDRINASPIGETHEAFEVSLRRVLKQGSADGAELFALLQPEPNDLEAAAISLQPEIAEVLLVLRALPECRLARMSGSGATCFALCPSPQAATAAASALSAAHPRWWVIATSFTSAGGRGRTASSPGEGV